MWVLPDAPHPAIGPNAGCVSGFTTLPGVLSLPSKLHFSEINTTHRADVTTKQEPTHFSVLQCGVRVFSLHSIPGDRRRNRKYNSVHSQHIYRIDMGIDNITAV